MAKVLYFSGTTQLDVITSMPNKQFEQTFGAEALKSSRRSDGFQKLVGFIGEGNSRRCFTFEGALPVTRVIFRKSNPSNHKCGARCRHAKGGDCECACGGKYHGAGNG